MLLIVNEILSYIYIFSILRPWGQSFTPLKIDLPSRHKLHLISHQRSEWLDPESSYLWVHIVGSKIPSNIGISYHWRWLDIIKTYYSLYSTNDVVLLKYLFYNYFFFSNFSYHVVVLHCIFKICILFSFPFPILNQILVLSILNWICLFWNDKLLWPPTLCCCWWVQEILCGFFHHSQHHPSICILFLSAALFFLLLTKIVRMGQNIFLITSDG